MPYAAPILIEQLRDNDTIGDERIAADALRHFGPAIIPILTPHFESDDAQLRTWCGRLVREVREAENGLTPAPILPSRHMLVYQPGSNNTPATLPADP
jgi:HEAT repeat protein